MVFSSNGKSPFLVDLTLPNVPLKLIAAVSIILSLTEKLTPNVPALNFDIATKLR